MSTINEFQAEEVIEKAALIDILMQGKDALVKKNKNLFRTSKKIIEELNFSKDHTERLELHT